MVSVESAPPAFVRLAGHDVRWRLLHLLARSDRRVRELVDLVGEPQNLVSYHLGRLRSAGVLIARRSNADGRDVYYRLDLTRCAELLAGTATALHPGLAAPSASQSEQRPRRTARVLFLCTGNSARSPMAAALLRHRAGDGVDVSSAGSAPRPVEPRAVRAMRDFGIDLADHRPRHLDDLAGRRFDQVISLCDRVREVCPEFPHRPAVAHWSIPNPAEVGTDAAFRRTANELDDRIRFLVAALGPTASPREAS